MDYIKGGKWTEVMNENESQSLRSYSNTRDDLHKSVRIK